MAVGDPRRRPPTPIREPPTRVRGRYGARRVRRLPRSLPASPCAGTCRGVSIPPARSRSAMGQELRCLLQHLFIRRGLERAPEDALLAIGDPVATPVPSATTTTARTSLAVPIASSSLSGHGWRFTAPRPDRRGYREAQQLLQCAVDVLFAAPAAGWKRHSEFPCADWRS